MYRYLKLFLVISLFIFVLKSDASTAKVGFITDIHDRASGSGSISITDDPDGGAYPGTGYRFPNAASSTVSVGAAVTTWNAETTAINIFCGDNINGTTGGTKAENLAKLLSDLTGVLADCYMNVGHWDIGSDSTNDAAYQEFFGDASYASITGGNADDLWWPAAITDDTPVGYIVDETIDGQVWRFIICPYNKNHGDIDFSTAGEWDNDGGGAAAITLGNWLIAKLQEADAAGYPCIVSIHERLVDTTGDEWENWSWSVTSTEDDETVIAAMEALDIPPVVLQGHIHVAGATQYCDAYEIVNNVLYIDGCGDLWGPTNDDTGRYSHSVLTLSYPAYTDAGGKTHIQAKLDGYGYQAGFDWVDPIVAYLRCEDPDTIAAADGIRDAIGSHHLDPSAAADVDAVGIFDTDNVYCVNRALNCSGAWYASNTGDTPVSALPISVSMWLKTNDASASVQNIFYFGDSGTSNRGLALRILTGVLFMYTQGNITAETHPTSNLINVNDNEWHHVVAIWADTDDRSIYVDGTFISQSTISEPTPASITGWAICYGADSTPDGEDKYIGYLDELQVYSGDLTGQEVKTLYNQGTKKFDIKLKPMYKGMY